MKIIAFLLMPIVLFVGLNYRQLYSAWAIRSEMQRLARVAANAPHEFQNPAPLKDNFDGKLSADFWEFTTINGAGTVSNENAWHSASMIFDNRLTIQHFPDAEFENEDADLMHKPAAEQYNNVTLIGASGFRPTESSDVVLKFSLILSENFYGTAGIIFQPVGTLQNDGWFVKPFDMFGFSFAGKESSVTGANGPLCYLALNWIPVQIQPLDVNPQSLHTYEIRLRWISQTGWLGSIKVDDAEQCQISVPAFGPVEVHVWSDNALVSHRPRHWWEIAPAMGLKFQDGGDKQLLLDTIQVFEEMR
jgi:hypothetical protein